MVLRARWILVGAGETEGDEEAVAEDEEEDEEEDGEGETEEEGAGARTTLLLPGPETLIFARPGDNVEDVEGEEEYGEEDTDERDFAACPAAGFVGEETGDHFSPSSPALEASFPGGCDDSIGGIPHAGSVFLSTAGGLKDALSPFT